MQHPGYAPVSFKVFHRARDGRPLGMELRYAGMPYRVTVKKAYPLRSWNPYRLRFLAGLTSAR